MPLPRSARPASLALAIAVLAATAGCGSGGSTDASPPSPSSGTDRRDPGDDLLDGPRRGVELAGLEQRITWRFPESYEAASGQQASSSDGDVDHQLTVGAKPGVDRVSEGEALADETSGAEQLGVGGEVDVEGATEEITVGDLELTLATLDSPTTSLRAFLLTPDDEDATYAVLFRTSTSLEDTAAERLEEVYQMVASLELEPAQGAGDLLDD